MAPTLTTRESKPSDSLRASRNTQEDLSVLPPVFPGTDRFGNAWEQGERVEFKPRLGYGGDMSLPGSESDFHKQIFPGFPRWD